MGWRKADVFWISSDVVGLNQSWSSGVDVRLAGPWLEIRDDQGEVTAYPAERVARIRWRDREPVHPALEA